MSCVVAAVTVTLTRGQAEVWIRPLPSGGSSAAALFCSSDRNRILESH